MGVFCSAKRAGIVLVLCVAAVAAPTGGQSSAGKSSSGESSSGSGKSSSGKSVASLSSLPPGAQGPISAVLGKDDSNYWAHRNAEGFREENPRHELVAEFTRDGAEVRSHNLGWRLETRGYGYGDTLHRLKALAPQANGNRVEYRRDGLTEWYENGPLGLEQGFTLAHRPGKGNGQKPLTVELGLNGDLVATMQPGGKALELRRVDRQAVLLYTGLKVIDAAGQELPSWMEIRGERLLLRVDDRGARYPVVVDPWIQQGELLASDGKAQDLLGDSVAISGTTVVVGAPDHTFGKSYSQGAAYVFVESGGKWRQQAELKSSDGAGYDNFGWSVAVSGNIAVVGAPCHTNSNGQCGQGAAYVFDESGGKWTQQAELTASDGATGDGFGWSVALDGNTAVVGAYDKTVHGHAAQGAAYVFAESNGTWTQQAELIATDGTYTDEFGYSVALSGSTVLIGAPYRTVGSNQAQGTAYVFAGSGGMWSQQAELTASDGEAGDFFAQSVAVDGGTAVMGAPCHPRNGFAFCQGGPGAAYVFGESGETWSQQAELTSSDGAAGDEFGVSVSVTGSTILAGASLHTVGSNQGQGAAYVFTESGETWSQQAELAASDGLGGDYFGWSVSLSGSTSVLGAPAHAVGSNPSQGSAYVFGSSGPLFTLSAVPNTLSVVQGTQATSTITITPENGFQGSVSLAASGLPSGVTAVFNPNPATSTSTLTLTASTTATTGTATVIVAGTSGSLAQTTTLTLTVVQAVPTAVLSPTLLNFGNQGLDTKSHSQAVTLTNTGTGTLYIYNIAISPSTNFNISSNNCGSALNAGSNCQVGVDFRPKVLGALSASLIFGDGAANSPQTVSLSGTGVAVTLTPASAIYSKEKVGNASQPKIFTLTNRQSVALTNIVISTTGDFAVSATSCGTSLGANSKCSISVTFAPTQTGTRTGQLSVSDSASNSPQTANLTGTGN